ncbi:MAG: MBL fold metallo-hydrolase, partial [Gemmatimonadetes bacterium]|nr:MBL fold metallo-hydrolase [Gemmatimonadota bacterium]
MTLEVTAVRGMENAYLLTGGPVALVDTMGPRGYRKIVKALAEKGYRVEDVEYILITHHHYDHAGCAARIKELSGATVIAGAADAPVIDGSAPSPPPGTLNRLGRFARRLPKSLVESYQKFPEVGVDSPVSGGEVIEELGL